MKYWDYFVKTVQIDGNVFIDEILEVGQIYKIKITDYLDYDLKGELLWIFQIKYL